MSKMKQIAALTAMLVGVVLYASPVKSAVCFLPDDDGSCGGGDIEISDGSNPDNKPEEKCEDFPVSAADYEKMKNCFDFTSCTKSKTKEVKYKQGGKISGTSWNASNKICCTNGESYDATEGQCCPAGGCTHECDAPKEWSSTLRSCECPNGKETSTATCCADDEHVDGAICCPEKKHNDGGKCVCDSQYNTDKDGNCVLPVGCTYEYRQATTEDSAGVSGNLDDGYKCVNGSECWKKLYYVKSIIARTGTPSVMPIYNKISNKSATCLDENNVTKYQTICEGTPKSECDTNGGYYEFTPNGCVSDTYNNGFEVKGDEFGSCTQTEEKCFYEYARLTISDTAGTDTFNTNSGLYSKFQNRAGNTKSASYYALSTDSYQAYSKIDKTSKTCTKINGTIAYEKICTGTAKVACKKTFTPTCFSEGYIVPRGSSPERSVEAMEFGICGCNTIEGLFDTENACKNTTQLQCIKKVGEECYQTCESAGFYSTSKACRNATNLGCTSVSGCYRSCESLGYYTTREACEKDMSAGERCLTPGAAQGNSNCFVRSKTGWGLHYARNVEDEDARTYSCTLKTNISGVSSSEFPKWTAMVSGKDDVNATKDVNGNVHNSLSDDARYLAGEYRVCVNYGWDRYIAPTSLRLAKRTGEYCSYTYNSAAGRWSVDHSDFCTGLPYDPHSSSCITGTFEDGVEYYISAGMVTHDGRYNCSLKH